MYTFLIIDDEPVVREGISENIDWAAHGFELVGACRDGREGIQAIEELRPDVVLTDICMPFVDGLELAAYIADRAPGTKTLLLTGYDDFEYAQEAVKLKVSDFLLKPITPAEVREVLDRTRAELDDERRRQRDLDHLRQQLRESLPLLRERFLNRLVLGDVDSSEISRKLELLELVLPGPWFCVVIVDADRFEGDRDLTSIAIANKVDEVIASREGALWFQTQREQTALLVSAPERTECADRALECAEEISDLVRRTMRSTVSIGIGRAVSALTELEESYRDARLSLGQRLVLGPNQIVTADQARGSAETGETEGPSPRQEQQLRRALVREFKGGTADSTEEAITALVDAYRSVPLGFERCHIAMHRTLADLLAAMESVGVHYSEVPVVDDDPFEQLGGLKTLDSIEQWFVDLQRETREILQSRQRRHSASKALEAEAYIADHYAEAGLSLTRLCRVLSVSKSYFSPLFKAHTGMTFVEYLTAYRMDRAKELLASTDMKGYEVAGEVGFTDPHYFSLTFRKQTGLSPTEYREAANGVVR